MAELRVSELPTAASLDDSDLLLLSQVDANSQTGFSSAKTTNVALATKVAKQTNFSDLQTTSKNLIGAINEAASSGGATELDELDDVTITTPSDSECLQYDSTNQLWKNKDIMAVTETEDKTPYVYRQTPSGQYTVKEQLIGGSVVWNQLVNGVTSWTNSTTDTRANFQLYCTGGLTKNITQNGLYGYLIKPPTTTANITIKHNGSTSDIQIYKNNSVGVTADHIYLLSVNVTGTDPTTVGGISIQNLMLFDLTQAFGTTIANYIYTLEQNTSGSGVAWFRKYFDKLYYAYSAPTIQSTKVSSKVVKDSYNQTVATYDLSGSHLVKRKYALVDLGTLDWTYDAPNNRFQTVDLTSTAKGNATTSIPNILCQKYTVFKASDTSTTSLGITLFTSGSYVYVRVIDPNYTSKESFTTAMSGVYLLYELVTPTTETVTNPTLYGIWKLDANNNLYFDGDTCDDIPNPQIVENGGTEEFIDAEVTAGNRDVSMPVGGGHKYGNNKLIGELLQYIQS